MKREQTSVIQRTVGMGINKLMLLSLLCLPSLLWAENQALLVSLNQYAYVGPNLQGTDIDAANMQQLALKHLGFKKHQVHVLQDKQATKKAILAAIKTHLIKKTKPKDRVLFYFSGHGYQIADKDGDELEDGYKDGKDETLVAYDVAYNENTQTYTRMITDDELRELFDQIDDRQVTVIIDSCHSGSVTRGLGQRTATYLEKSIRYVAPSSTGGKSLSRSLVDVTDNPEYQSHRQEEPFIANTRNRVVWSAVTAGQKALVDFTAPTVQSVFTRWFIDGLIKRNADQDQNGQVSNAELLAYTRQKSAAHCAQHRQCTLGLNPVLQAPAQAMAQSLINALSNPVVSVAAEALPSSVLPERNTDTIDIVVEVNNKEADQIKLGESLFVAVNSKREGYLLLLDRDANTFAIKPPFSHYESAPARESSQIAA